MKATCSHCGNRWQLTPEALAMALETSPSKGRSIGVECPRCRHLVKLARPPQATVPAKLAPDAAPEPAPE